MQPSFLLPLIAMSLSLAACATDSLRLGRAPDAQPLVIAHRGASAHRPEHTLAAYQLAIEQGADVIEPDLVITRDGVLVARHENEIGGTTDVARHPEFARRKTRKEIDGIPVEGWFTEDFTLTELKTLRARERIPANRPANTAFDGQFEIPTLDEVIALVKTHEQKTGQRIAIYPETKHPSYFRQLGLPLEEPLVATLHAAGWRGKQAPVFIQSFEVGNLKRLRGMTDLPLVQLLDNPANAPAANGTPRNKPWDFIASQDPRSYADLATAAGLREIASYADAVGPYKEIVIPRTADNHLGQPGRFVVDAHAAGLAIHIWTLRPENPFLPVEFRQGERSSPSARGDMASEIAAYLKAGVDGFFSDDPLAARAAVKQFSSTR
ncbi:glycerophosphodiester phosphodiesterase [Uliginosibacterium sp. TH139]|uniref:glycerophosphodiester phosphodiesterase n=1 Tax=Uliginosibacterium sp. TH139 TaxID=2067453 RepID=UPI000C7CEB10|nr:glycerophosphodiester phosphodiesterase [Uliginosibacterium sp. TH139]PLK49709.1 glycerophosphodiester phosphodiesterase [Uliginosibacterium sp. TH139]